MSSKKVLMLSPYHGGSHQVWFENWRKHSRHEFTLLSLPARKWKWRMRGAAITLSDEFKSQYSDSHWDALVATDMMNLAEFVALARPAFDSCPIILYMHENQTSYPLHPDEQRDYHYAITNLLSMMVATRVVFNSAFNRDDFFRGIKKILKKMPDCKIDQKTIHGLKQKSCVIAPGIDTTGLKKRRQGNEVPVILWNHRWDYDKQPTLFANSILRLKEKGIAFQLILCGEVFQDIPKAFLKLKDKLGEDLIHFGYASSRKSYFELLRKSNIVVSTANQEFFGISVLEAIAAGAFPVMPNRLNYPYLIPKAYHDLVLYDHNRLTKKLEKTLQRFHEQSLPDLSCLAQSYQWSSLIEAYDSLF